MADPLSISAAGAAVVATASKAENVLISVAQSVGDGPRNVRLVLSQVQATKAVIVGLNTLLRSPTALPSHKRPNDWLKEVNRAVNATSVELSVLYTRLGDWDQLRGARKLQSAWPVFRVALSSDQLDKSSGRIQLANSALSLLIFCPQESSATPEREMYLDQARSVIESLLQEQAADIAPTTDAKRPSSLDSGPGTGPDSSGRVDLSPYRHPPGSLFGDIPFRATRSSQQLTDSLVDTAPKRSDEAVSQINDIAALKRGVAAKDKRIAELETELAKLSDDSSSQNGGPKDEVFRAVVTKYKSVKKLYFDSQKEIDELRKQVEDLKASEKTSVGKDKVIEAWKEQYEMVSKQLRSQDESNDIMKMWREIQHDGFRETTARPIEELRKENSLLAHGRETFSTELEKERSGVTKIVANNAELGAEVSRLTRELEDLKLQSKKTTDAVQRFSIIWKEAGKVVDGLIIDALPEPSIV
ncbi:hypothetical protein OQA88_9685 [Cercophora sp. LCS_1]